MAQEGTKHLGERRLPMWLALLLVLLFGGGAILGIWKLMRDEKPAVEAVAIDGPVRGARQRPARAQGIASDQLRPENAKVFKRNDGLVRAINDNYILLV